MTASELRITQDRYEEACHQTSRRRIERNAAVRKALADGWTHAQIAASTGLSRGRIGQLASR